VDQPRRYGHCGRAGRYRRRHLLQSHVPARAAAHGGTGWHAHAFPLSVDGVEIVASLVLLADRRTGRKSGWLPWAALTIGTAASLAANIATADQGIVSRVIAGWPVVALLIAVKLLSGILEHRDIATTVLVADGPDCHRFPDSDRSRRRLSRIDDLLQAASAVRDELRIDGLPLTRDVCCAKTPRKA